MQNYKQTIEQALHCFAAILWLDSQDTRPISFGVQLRTDTMFAGQVDISL